MVACREEEVFALPSCKAPCSGFWEAASLFGGKRFGFPLFDEAQEAVFLLVAQEMRRGEEEDIIAFCSDVCDVAIGGLEGLFEQEAAFLEAGKRDLADAILGFGFAKRDE